MSRLLITPVAVAVALGVSGTASGGYPKPLPKDLAKPFAGASVPSNWLGKWQQKNGQPTVWQMFSKRSPACHAITAGRASCFTMKPEGLTDVWAGAISLARGKVVLRMTSRPRPNTFGCFDDDAYAYRISAHRLSIRRGSRHSCFFEPTAPFPIILERLA